jgi:hypothetical protein
MSGGGDMTTEWLKRKVKKHICNILCIVNKTFNPHDYSISVKLAARREEFIYTVHV